jgi:hypothetical protein
MLQIRISNEFMNKRLILIIIILLFTQCLQAQSATNFSAASIQRHLEFLGSDLFEGRGTGTTGGNLAAKYIALELEKLNLKPAGNNGTFYQYIPMHGNKILPGTKLTIIVNNEQIDLEYGQDYYLFKSGEQTFIPNPLPLVFVGYGIFAPEFDYNDYQSVDITGKIAVMLEGEPVSNDKDYFGGKAETIYSFAESKLRMAISRGAAGSIIIPQINNSVRFQNEKIKKGFGFEDVTLAYAVSSNLGLLIEPTKAELLFEGSGQSLNEIIELHDEGKMKSFELAAKLSFRGEFMRRDFVASNIAGILEGSDPDLNDEFIILSAHYDHLGVGPSVKGDSIYNGVQDNALGVSCLLELAAQLSKTENNMKRSLLFLFLTGEEKGLLGSTYYTDHPLVPLYKTVANINIDGLSIFDEVDSFIGIGSSFSTIQYKLNKAAAQNNLKIEELPEGLLLNQGFNKSDQIAFAKAGIPSVLIVEGPEYKNISYQEGLQKNIHYHKEIYHSPFDDLGLAINYNAVLQHLNLIKDLTVIISNDADAPEWLKGSPYINARLRTIAEKR